MALPPKGTMRPVKLIVGLILALLVVNSLITLPVISTITEFLDKIPYLQTIVMAIAAYFLIVTGRQL